MFLAIILVLFFLTFLQHLINSSLRVTTDKLQQVMNSAARVVSNTRKFDGGLSRLLHDELHWLDVTNWVQFKLTVLIYRCLHGMAPLYLMDSCTPMADVAGHQHLWSASQRKLMDSCTPMADVAGHQHLWSASQRKLIVPRYRLNSFGCHVVGVLLLWVRRPGIRCQAVFVIQHWVSTFLGVSWRHFFAKYWRDVLGALEIFWVCAI